MGPERLERRRPRGNGKKAGSRAWNKVCARNQTTVRRFPLERKMPSTVTRGRSFFSAAGVALPMKAAVFRTGGVHLVDPRGVADSQPGIIFGLGPERLERRHPRGDEGTVGFRARNRACAGSNKGRWNVPSGGGTLSTIARGLFHRRQRKNSPIDYSSPNFCASFLKSRP